MPDGINQLRLGESILVGREPAYGRQIEGTSNDCFKLIAEIIEMKVKPSIPSGELGMDAFGNPPCIEDKGRRIRAICAVGKQDIHLQNMVPEDQDISVIGASSDHLILDMTECHQTYQVGSLVSFRLSYAGILSTMTSDYVNKDFI
jgi:predicted amino acid racemase